MTELVRPERTKRIRCQGGWVEYYEHVSSVCASKMRFAVFVPPQAETTRVPILYFLSGLTCTEENFTAKSGVQRWAAQHGIMIVAPDTSPRETGIEGEDTDWDFGTGAGFYVNATQKPWSKFYNMYDYVNNELPAIVHQHFNVDSARESIFGHSMGGHGALVSALRQPGRFQSVSAFAPIANPTQCAWGHKAFSGYLGDDRSAWEAYDSVCLLQKTTGQFPLLVDQGTEDNFLAEQLRIDELEQVCLEKNFPLTLRRQPGYDHSYFFISTFINEHIEFHGKHLNA